MSKGVAFPYRTITDDSVSPGPWKYCSEGGDAVQIPQDGLEGWDYDFSLILERDFEIDTGKCFADAGLDPGNSVIKLVVSALTGEPGNPYRYIVFERPLSGGALEVFPVRIRINSEELASAMTIKTEIVLGENQKNNNEFVSYRKSSRLWEETFIFPLEGSLDRFPMQILPFTGTFPNKDALKALWYLHWSSEDLSGNFMGNVILYLNSNNEDFIRKLNSGDYHLHRIIAADVVRQICMTLLERQEFVENIDDYSEESLGGVTRTWLQVAFGGQDFRTLDSRYSTGVIESIIQATFSGGDPADE